MVNLKNKSSLKILKSFETLDIDAKRSIKVEFLQTDIDKLGYKFLTDLAQIFFMKIVSIVSKKDTVEVEFYKLDKSSSFHKVDDKTHEKYGIDSEFFAIDKAKEVTFLYYYIQALNFVNLQNKKKILNLGINKGDEFQIIKNILTQDDFYAKEFVGVDYSLSAIGFAKEKMIDENINFLCHDINTLDEVIEDKFDLIISIGTLQSSNINFNQTFMKIYQNYLSKEGAIILGFPNCRWIDKEMIYGAKTPNYNFSEMGLVLKDIHFCKKYLQQKGYRVVITGKEYLFLSARKIVR
ncbi:MAG: methyltransferase domain-containing protein [Epsilonproteobacteria bacterium]|nr:methyltransferase domain-containing protein [Campylobacterota bacterium]